MLNQEVNNLHEVKAFSQRELKYRVIEIFTKFVLKKEKIKCNSIVY
jgi:hypothetical protein